MAPTVRIEISGDCDKLHVDRRKAITRSFHSIVPITLFSEPGAWQIDKLAQRAPWREVLAPGDAITLCRVAVHRALQAANDSIRSERRSIEARTVVRKGLLDGKINPIRQLRNALADQELMLTPSTMTAWLCAGSIAARAGLEPPPPISAREELASWLAVIESKSAVGSGRTASHDLNAFFQSFVGFWDRNMSTRAPSSRRSDVKGRKLKVGFHDLAAAAAQDVGANSNLERAISRAVVAVRQQERLKP